MRVFEKYTFWNDDQMYFWWPVVSSRWDNWHKHFELEFTWFRLKVGITVVFE